MQYQEDIDKILEKEESLQKEKEQFLAFNGYIRFYGFDENKAWFIHPSIAKEAREQALFEGFRLTWAYKQPDGSIIPASNGWAYPMGYKPTEVSYEDIIKERLGLPIKFPDWMLTPSPNIQK